MVCSGQLDTCDVGPEQMIKAPDYSLQIVAMSTLSTCILHVVAVASWLEFGRVSAEKGLKGPASAPGGSGGGWAHPRGTAAHSRAPNAIVAMSPARRRTLASPRPACGRPLAWPRPCPPAGTPPGVWVWAAPEPQRCLAGKLSGRRPIDITGACNVNGPDRHPIRIRRAIYPARAQLHAQCPHAHSPHAPGKCAPRLRARGGFAPGRRRGGPSRPAPTCTAKKPGPFCGNSGRARLRARPHAYECVRVREPLRAGL